MNLQTLETIFLSPTLIPFYVTICLYGLHKIALWQKWNDERWLGTVHATIQILHSSGIDASAPNWMKEAEIAFEATYTKTNGVAPSSKDVMDGVTDIARILGPQIAGVVINKMTLKNVTPIAIQSVTTPSTNVPNS